MRALLLLLKSMMLLASLWLLASLLLDVVGALLLQTSVIFVMFCYCFRPCCCQALAASLASCCCFSLLLIVFLLLLVLLLHDSFFAGVPAVIGITAVASSTAVAMVTVYDTSLLLNILCTLFVLLSQMNFPVFHKSA